MTNLIVILVLLLIIGGAAAFIIRQKKRGVKCIGCPDGTKCASSQGGCGGNCAGCSGAAGRSGKALPQSAFGSQLPQEGASKRLVR